MNRLTALTIPALLAIMMLTSQSTSANWIGGFNYFGEPRCVNGWNHAIIQAQTGIVDSIPRYRMGDKYRYTFSLPLH
jgi:hypothetical protein